MTKTCRSVAMFISTYVLGISSLVAGPSFQDPLVTPAQISALAAKSPLMSVAKAGSNLVAVGQRGHILVSLDKGVSWKQSKVPVSSDLTAVYFVGERKGWATGHDGVVLHTMDGGQSWEKQLDGKIGSTLMLQDIMRRVEKEPTSSDLHALLEEAKRFAEQGADKPFLGLWFADENNGYVVGAYNLIFKTTDGGRNWTSLFADTDNSRLMHLYAIAPAGGDLYVVGEGGLIMKLDPDSQTFKSLRSTYVGSYFGLVGNDTSLLAFGLRGNVFRSVDKGRTFVKKDVGLSASIVSGKTTSKGEIVLADSGGRVVVSRDQGETFTAVSLTTSAPVADLVEVSEGQLIRVGRYGASVVGLPVR